MWSAHGSVLTSDGHTTAPLLLSVLAVAANSWPSSDLARPSFPRLQNGYDHLDTPGLKVPPRPLQKKSALLRPEVMLKLEAQPVTAC